MLAAFKLHIESHFPFIQNSKLLIACSGGLDSVVLATLAKKLDYDFALAHCNFNLRGEESVADQEFVNRFSKDLNVPIYIKSFDTKKQVQIKGGSIQMVARDLRYKWFNQLLIDEAYDYILTGHHADDSLETFLINLSRGTGIHGLTGIPEKNNKIIRPLLKFSREDILTFAEINEILWREDQSNSETKYLRNQIRQELVPRLKNLNINFLNNFINSQERLKESSIILDNTKKELQKRLFLHEDGILKISIGQLQKLQPINSYLYLLFQEFGFTAWNDILNLLQTESGKEVYSQTHRLVKDRENLLLITISNTKEKKYFIHKNDKEIKIPLELKIEVVATMADTHKNILYVDMENLIFPLVLRKWSNGDYFYPLGMQGKKKLSKYFKDEKISIIEKEQQWLLCSNDKIVWVVGRRADERFKVSPKTKKVLKITWQE